MRSDGGMRLAAILVVLASCASADDLMHAYTGKKAGTAQDVGTADPGPADSGIPEESWDTTDRGPDPAPDVADGEADVEDVPDAQDTSDIVCLPQDHKGCAGGNVYWYDSCGVQGALAQTCSCGCTGGACDCCPSCPACRTVAVYDGCSGTCAVNCAGTCSGDTCCLPKDHKGCAGGNVYWYDSCGVQGALAETCQYGCTAGACAASFTCPTGYVPVYPGTFTMGSPTSEPGRDTDEVQHAVTISKGFCLKETEVTQGEWQAAMGNNPSYFSSCGPSCPVEGVSWWDAVAYCNQLSANEGLPPCYTLTNCSGTPGTGNFTCTGVTFTGLSCTGYRLPTESEWEYAARAGTTAGTYNGTSSTMGCEEPNPVLDPIAWFCGNSGSKTHPVKGKQPNAWGLYDMLGNVWEWVWDWYGAYPGTVTDPTGATTGSIRVRRGGSWNNNASFARAALRDYDDPGFRNDNLGFRPAMSRP